MKKKFHSTVYFFFLINTIGFAQLNGDYIISSTNPDVNFQNIQNAVAELNTLGVSGPVNFLIDEDQFVVVPIVIGSFLGASATNTVTIKPNDGKTVVIQGAFGGAQNSGDVKGIIELTNTSYVTLDGNNGTSNNNLKIYNSYNLNDWAHSGVIWIKDGTHHCTIQNLSVQAANRTIGTADYYFAAGIYSGGNITGALPAYTDPTHSDNITINNVIFLDTKDPFYVNGDSTTTNWAISNCTISDDGPLGVKPVFGVVLFNVNNYTIDHNSISNVLKTTNNTITACGISIRGTSSNGTISNNVIRDIRNNLNNNGSYSGGIIVFSAGGGTGGATIYNNMISEVTNAANDDNDNFNFHNKGHGIIIRGSNSAPVANNGGVNIWNNTILINSTMVGGGRNSCLYVEEYSNSAIDVRNNIFTNRSTNVSATYYSILMPGVNLPTISRMNYNSHYISTVGGNFRARKGDIEYLTTGTWNVACGDPESDFSNIVDPVYVSITDLHLEKIVNPNSLLAISNEIIPSVTTDIDGDTRTRPYRGADEASICFENAIWDGASWDITPKNDSNLVFNGDYNDNVDVSGCNCTVNAGADVVIPSEKVMTIQENIVVNAGGTLTFENGASLIQLDENAVNTGSIVYKRTVSGIKDKDYVYWSSPVVGQTLGAFSPGSEKFYSWYVSNWATANSTTVMKPAKGYIVLVPPATSGPSIDLEFEGTPNNGVITITSQGVSKKNLIGNPYPSAINAEQFMIANQAIIGGALHFWTHNTPRVGVGAGDVFVYASNDYASFNGTGGTAAGSGGAAPDGNIGAGQSFFVQSNYAGNFTFNNALRIKDSGNNSQFFKQTKTKKTGEEKNRIWLNLTNAGGAFKQLLIGYVTGATNEFDNLYDAVTLDANKFIDFYSIANSNNYVIQGRALPFDSADIVPLGYRTTIEGTFQISIDEVDGVLMDQDIFLEDKMTNTVHNLKEGSYSFTTAIGVFTDRFVLKYADSSLGTDDNHINKKGLFVSVKNSKIKINSFDQKLTAVKIYDLKGAVIYDKEKIGTNQFTVEHLNTADQIMIVMVQLENGKWMSDEIVFSH
ncbi:hypothetical protein [Flavobacterium adhaerens]|uniref:hypothetical protein n=1 Tax=Flavobacterium adhaerens TaxID=3149043 RepID=UPI0032B3EC1B